MRSEHSAAALDSTTGRGPLGHRGPHGSYDPLTIAFHWTTAVLVVTLFGLAEIWGFFPKPERHLLIVAHMSLGIVLTAVLVGRIAWRLTRGRPEPISTGWMEIAAKLVHFALYAMLTAQAALGFAFRWSGDEPMSFFGLELPSPWVTSKPVHELIGESHDLLGWAIVILAGGHAAAALYHHYVLRDGVLRRMLPKHGAGDAA